MNSWTDETWWTPLPFHLRQQHCSSGPLRGMTLQQGFQPPAPHSPLANWPSTRKSWPLFSGLPDLSYTFCLLQIIFFSAHSRHSPGSWSMVKLMTKLQIRNEHQGIILKNWGSQRITEPTKLRRSTQEMMVHPMESLRWKPSSVSFPELKNSGSV